jgi:hypothetical protein
LDSNVSKEIDPRIRENKKIFFRFGEIFLFSES